MCSQQAQDGKLFVMCTRSGFSWQHVVWTGKLSTNDMTLTNQLLCLASGPVLLKSQHAGCASLNPAPYLFVLVVSATTFLADVPLLSLTAAVLTPRLSGPLLQSWQQVVLHPVQSVSHGTPNSRSCTRLGMRPTLMSLGGP